MAQCFPLHTRGRGHNCLKHASYPPPLQSHRQAQGALAPLVTDCSRLLEAYSEACRKAASEGAAMQLQVDVCRRGLVASCMHHAMVRGTPRVPLCNLQVGRGLRAVLPLFAAVTCCYTSQHVGGSSCNVSPPHPPIRCAAPSMPSSISVLVAALSVDRTPTLGPRRPHWLASTRHCGGRKMRSAPS